MCNKTTATTAPTTSPQVNERAGARATGHRSGSGASFRAFLLGLGRDGIERRRHSGSEESAAEDGACRPHLASLDRAAHRAHQDKEDRGTDDSAQRRDDDALSALELEPFTAPPAILAPPVAQTGTAPASGSPLAHAQAAALAERLLTSLRVGRVGRDGHEVRMRIAISERADVEVQLRLVDGELTARFVAPAHATTEAERLASALRTEFGARGVTLDEVSVELG